MMELSDEQLMLNYSQGDIAAFESLYQGHKNSLYRYFLRQCDTADIAEELYQDTWKKLIKARSSYQVSAKFSTWLYRIAHNVLIDYYRSSQVKNKWQCDDYENSEQTNLVLHNAVESDELAYQQQQASALKHCLAQLPRPQKEAFLLKYEASLSLTEIAELVEETAQGIKSRIRYALAKLKRCLALKLERCDD